MHFFQSSGIIRAAGRALSLLSLMILLMIGGTFSHTNDLPHQHLNQSTNEIGHEVANHDHISDADLDGDQLNGMHCGADIHCLVGDLNIVFEQFNINRFPQYGRQYSKTSFWPEPPPPRSIS